MVFTISIIQNLGSQIYLKDMGLFIIFLASRWFPLMLVFFYHNISTFRACYVEHMGMLQSMLLLHHLSLYHYISMISYLCWQYRVLSNHWHFTIFITNKSWHLLCNKKNQLNLYTSLVRFTRQLPKEYYIICEVPLIKVFNFVERLHP